MKNEVQRAIEDIRENFKAGYTPQTFKPLMGEEFLKALLQHPQGGFELSEDEAEQLILFLKEGGVAELDNNNCLKYECGYFTIGKKDE